MGAVFVGFVGHSGSGKTTLIEKLIPLLVAEGLRVGAVKHDAHRFEIDHPGKDSYRMKHAGARRVVISSKDKLAMVEDRDREASLSEIKRMFTDCDIVLVEGYKLSDIPKIEVHRAETGFEYLIERGVKGIILVVTDEDVSLGVPTMHIDDIGGIANFLKAFINP